MMVFEGRHGCLYGVDFCWLRKGKRFARVLIEDSNGLQIEVVDG